MNDLEQRLRSSLQARADDVEATPQLWEEVNRRVRRNAWQTGLLWAAGATAAAAAAVVAIVVIPGVLETPDQDVVVDPVPTETATDVAPTEDPTEDPGPATGGAPTHLVTASDREIVVTTLDGQAVDTLVNYDSPEFEGAIQSVAVRPGSTLDDLVVAFTVVVEGDVEVRVVERGGDWQQVDETHTGWFEIVPPQAVWSPDGSRLAWIDTTDGQVELKAAEWAEDGFGDAAPMGSADGLAELQLQEWLEQGRIQAIANGLSLRTITLDGRQVTGVDPSRPDTTVLDTATTTAGTYTLVIPRPDVSEEQGDAESAVPELQFAPADGSSTRSLPLPDAMTIGTAQPQGMWVDAQQDRAVVGWGGLAWVVGLDGSPSQLPGQVNAAALFGNGTAEPSPEPTTSETAAPTDDPGATSVEGGPFLVVTEGEMLLVDDGSQRVVMDWPDDDEFKPARAEVRPGSTPDDLVAIVLSAGEGETELGWIEVRGGELIDYRRFPDAYQMNRPLDGASVSVPVWSPDGDYVGWVEEATDESFDSSSSFGLRFVGWNQGPGTGETATDNTSFALDGFREEDDVVLDQWVWNSDSEGMLTFRTQRDGVSGYATMPVERQPDGALAFPPDTTITQHAAVDEALTEAAVYRLVDVDGQLVLRIQTAGSERDVQLPSGYRGDLVRDLPPAAGPYLDVAPAGALLFSPDQRAWHVTAEGAVTEVGSGVRDLDALG